ncbi:MAG: FkbM family methyltransferase [Hyphomicrobium sp.]
MTTDSGQLSTAGGAIETQDYSRLVGNLEKYKSERGGAHRAGTLTHWPLKQIQHYLETYFRGQQIRTAETGCGASTILFSKFSSHHTVYCYDDRTDENSSVAFAQECPLYVPDHVTWSFGPTQETLLKSPPREPLDMVLIDGPHGYPFPELEYFTFWPLLKRGAVLVIDDIHIPTIRNLYRFLCEDEMFYPMRVVENTAFFQRTDVPAFDRTSDGWWTQRYNVQRFREPAGYSAKLEVPFSIDLENGAGLPAEWLRRGFFRENGDTFTDGMVAIMELPLTQPLVGKTKIDLDVEGAGLAERPGAELQIAINSHVFPAEKFEDQVRKKLSYVIEPDSSEFLTIKFHSYGLAEADQIPNFSASGFDKRLPGLLIRNIAVRPAGNPDYRWEDISHREGAIVAFRYDERRIRFFVDQPNDAIQAHHAAGQFYEREELELIRSHVKAGASVLDIGANVGNHTVFFERVLGAKRVVPVEPCPRAVELLRLNALINGLTCTDMRYLGIALSNKAEFGVLKQDATYNLGGTSIQAGGAGNITMLRGDSVFRAQAFDLIKIDVEGQETEVLEGLTMMLLESKPAIFIEVWDKNRSRFDDLIRTLGYRIVAEHRRYDTMTNFMIAPKART